MIFNRARIRVSGPDAVGFLDNLLTQDVARTAENGGYAALLTPQGKVVADMFVRRDALPDDPGLLIDIDPTRAEEVTRRLTMYKLRAQVTIENLGPTLSQLLYRGDAYGSWAEERQHMTWQTYLVATTAGDDALYETQRIALGFPDLARDAAPDEVFALEALLEELNGVDFQKGCFVGQENVSRMKRRATTRKKFCPIVFDGEPPAYGTTISAGAAELGTVRTGVDGRAMALIRLDRALAAAEGGVALEADGRPIRLDPPPWLILPPREGAA